MSNLGSNIVVVSRTVSNTPELVKKFRRYFGKVKFNRKQKLAHEQLADFIGKAKGAVVALEEIDDYVLDRCPNLEIIAKYGVGLDNIDVEACNRRHVKVGWTGGTNRLSVAEMTLAFMISLSRNIFRTSIELKRGLWNKNGGAELSKRTVGIIGVGNTGREVIRLLKPFNCRILVNDIIDIKDYCRKEGLEQASKEKIFKKANIVSLHVPLTEETRHMVNERVLSSMRPDAYVVNTARGPLIDYNALERALRAGKIAGAAVDVYYEEPPKCRKLITLDNVICTPHIGGNSREAVNAMGVSAIEHLRKHFCK